MSTSAYKDQVQGDSAHNYWRLGESSGTSAVDEQSNNNGTYQPNSLGSWTGGTLAQTGVISYESNTSVLFNGSTGYISTSGLNTTFGALSAATLEGWIYRSNTGHLVTFGFGTTANRRFNILWYTDGFVYFQVEDGSNTFGKVALSGTGWHHVVLVFDDSAGGTDADKLKGYVDGVVKTLTITGTIPSALASSANIGAFEIGRENANSRFTTGRIDEVSIYTTALTAATVYDHFFVGSAYFDFIGNQSNTDFYGYALNSTGFFTSGVFTGMSFSGSSSSSTLPTSGQIWPRGLGEPGT